MKCEDCGQWHKHTPLECEAYRAGWELVALIRRGRGTREVGRPGLSWLQASQVMGDVLIRAGRTKNQKELRLLLDHIEAMGEEKPSN